MIGLTFENIFFARITQGTGRTLLGLTHDTVLTRLVLTKDIVMTDLGLQLALVLLGYGYSRQCYDCGMII